MILSTGMDLHVLLVQLPAARGGAPDRCSLCDGRRKFTTRLVDLVHGISQHIVLFKTCFCLKWMPAPCVYHATTVQGCPQLSRGGG